MMKKEFTNTEDREFVIERFLNAPVELVYQAWTDPEHLIRWWGPNGFTNTFHEINVKPGGVWRFMMHGPDGVDYPNKVVYDEVIENKLLTYSHGSDEVPEQFYVIVTFESLGEKTKLKMRGIFPTAEAWNEIKKSAGAVEGGNQTMDKLEKYLEEMPDRA